MTTPSKYARALLERRGKLRPAAAPVIPPASSPPSPPPSPPSPPPSPPSPPATEGTAESAPTGEASAAADTGDATGAAGATDAAASAEISAAPQPATEAPAPAPAVIKATFASSNVREAELEVATGVLTVSFEGGKRYRYANFTAALLTEWQQAKSAGSWFHNNVRQRPNVYPATEVADVGDRVV